jgi:hypothetical protein
MLREDGRTRTGPLSLGKAPSKKVNLNGSGMKWLHEALHAPPALIYERRAEFLEELLGVRVSNSTICRAVRRLGYTRKRELGCE